MYTTYLLILSSFDRNRLLPCFCYCGITLLWTRCTNISSRPCFHFFGLHTRSGVAESYIILFFFEELPCCFPQWLYHFIFPPTLGVILMSEVVTHCAFDLHFPQWLMMLSIFSCAHWPFVYLLWRIIYSSLFAHFWIKLFVFLLLSCRSSLYILDTNPLSDIWFAIFPPILWVAFLLWILSFDILFF